MNILYFGYYSEENIALARHICKDGYSAVGLWETESMKKINIDFMSTGLESDPFFKKTFVVERDPTKEEIVDDIKTILISYSFKPDAIVIRGRVEDIWPVAALKVAGEIDYPCIALVDDMGHVLDDYDKQILDIFDIVIPFGGKETLPYGQIFTEFNPSEFINHKDLKISWSLLDNNQALILTNSDNFKELAGYDELKKEFISFVDVEKADDRDVCFYANASKVVVDATNNPEVRLIMSKMGKECVAFDEFDVESLSFDKDSYNFLENYKIGMSYFSAFINKEITKQLKNLKSKRDLPLAGEVIEIKEM